MKVNSKKLFIIDCQVFQTSSFYRGMGRYSYCFLQSLFSNYKNFFENKEVVFILNKNIEISKSRLGFIQKIYNKANLAYIDYPILDFRFTKNNIKIYRVLLDNFLHDRFGKKEITFLILSNFEIGQALSVFPDKIKSTNLLLFYDLIPQLFNNLYNDNLTSLFDTDYFERYINILNADHIFSISNTTRKDLITYLNIDPKKITSIAGALIDGGDKSLNSSIKKGTKDRIILYPTGDDPRKNNINSIVAFLNFSKKNNDYTLVITSKIGEILKNEIMNKKMTINKHAKIIFSGNIDNEELHGFYENCELVIFPSLYEGLGLPVLEAVKYNKKIVVSDLSVFREISEKAFYYCDPKDVSSIEYAIDYALMDKDFSRLKEYKNIKERYTWKNSVDIFVKKMAHILDSPEKKMLKRYRLAIVGPVLEGYSAISKYIEMLFPSIYEYFDIDYFYDNGQTKEKYKNSYISHLARYESIDNLTSEKYSLYDLFIYNIGNSEYHVNTVKKALVFPGLLILHDITLDGLFKFAINMNMFSKERVSEEMNLERSIKGEKSEFRLITSLINSSLGVFVHSNYVFNIIKNYLIYDIPIKKVDPAVSILPKYSKNRSNSKLTIGIAGIMGKIKGFDLFLEVARRYKKNDNISFKVFGYDPSNTLSEEYRESFEKLNCKFLKNLSEFDYQEELQSVDLLINVRSSYKGEASWTCMEAFRYGIPVIVRDVGWYSELPDDCVFKIKEDSEVFDVVSRVIEDKSILIKYSENCFSLARHKFIQDGYIKSLLNIFEEIKKNINDNPNKIMHELIRNDVTYVDPKILDLIYK